MNLSPIFFAQQPLSGARTESYSYDVNGNRTMAGYTTGADNRLTSDGTYNYTYDNDGNMLTKTRLSDGQVTTNTWDYRNRLTNIVVKDADGNILEEAQYTYDVNDRRIGVWEHVTGQTATQRWTVYDGDNAYADFDGAGSLTTRYLYGPAMDQLFARIGTTGNLDWYLTDNLGSVRQIVRSDGTVADNIAYDTFGHIVSESTPANGDRFKFTAREWDALFGQYYYRARYYGPETGRFDSEDPTGFNAGDSNLYRYVKNAPTEATDPSGLYTEWGNAFLAWIHSFIPQDAIYLRTANGEGRHLANANELLAALQQMQADGQTIQLLIVKGHGGPQGIEVGPPRDNVVFLTINNPASIFLGNNNVTALLRAITNPNSRISLRGCVTEDLASNVARILGNNAAVDGEVLPALAIPGTTITIGISRTYGPPPRPPREPHRPIGYYR